jgi:hypothetical protein
LQRLVDERDGAFTEKKALDRILRQRVSRRIAPQGRREML